MKKLTNFNFNNKNIIILLKSFVLGGAEKQALFLANYLQNNLDCNVFIYSYIKAENSELFYEECRKYQLKNLLVVKNPLSAAGRFKYIKRRVKLFLLGLQFRKHKPDIIIPYLNPPSIIAALTYKIAGATKTFWHHRGVDYYRNDKLERNAVKNMPLFIANSKSGIEELKENLYLNSSKKLFFLPNFNTIIKNQSITDTFLDDKKDTITIGMLAHFRSEKRQDIVLNSFVKLLDIYNNIFLIFAGNIYDNDEDESSYQLIEKYINKNKLENRVSIIHNQFASDFLPTIDIGILISDKEGMPNVIMEYMSYKIPIVASNHSGCISLLGDDYNFFVDNSLEDVSEKLSILIADKEKRNVVGKRNYERLINNFTIKKYITNLTKLLEK